MLRVIWNSVSALDLHGAGFGHTLIVLGQSTSLALVVRLAAMGNPGHVDCFSVIVYDVHNPVIADPNSPFLVAAPQFLAPRRAWCRRQTFEAWHYPGDHFYGQELQFLVRAGG
jgi:hypothetical protein